MEVRWQLVAAGCLVAVGEPAAPGLFGLNLPTKSGSSGTGAFLPGIYNLSYSAVSATNVGT